MWGNHCETLFLDFLALLYKRIEDSIDFSSLDMMNLVLPMIFTKIAQFLHNYDVIRA